MSRPEKTAAERIGSAMGAVEAIYKNTGPDVTDNDQARDFAIATLAESQIAIATALVEVAEAIRESSSST